MQETQAQEARPEESSGMRTLPGGQRVQPTSALVAPGGQPSASLRMQLWRRGQVRTNTFSLEQEVQPVPAVHRALVQPISRRRSSHWQASAPAPGSAWHFSSKIHSVMPLRVVSVSPLAQVPGTQPFASEQAEHDPKMPQVLHIFLGEVELVVK